MKTFSFFTALLIAATLQLSAGIVIVKEGDNSLRVVENDYSRMSVVNTLSSFHTMDVMTEEGLFTKLLVGSYSHSSEPGKPEVPVNRKLIEIPFGASIDVKIVSSHYIEYPLESIDVENLILPAQPPVEKDGSIPPIEWDREVYQENSFYPGNLAMVDEVGILRGLRVGRLNIFPIQYNPVTGTIRVYDELTVEVSFTGTDMEKTVREKMKMENPVFSSVSHFMLNHKETGSRDTMLSYPIKYVIVSDRMFEAQLQPLIEWKTKKGFEVIEAYTDEPNVGTTSFQIKSYLEDLYMNSDNPPSYVLLVGDVNLIPAWFGNAGGHVTDLYYCEYTNDYFPEVYYGRMSAKTTDHLQPQIDKTLQYEQYTMPDPSFLEEVVMVAGVDASFGHDWANGQINYGTQNYFNETNGITSHTYLYPESGNSSQAIIGNISDGVSYGNYTAHCNHLGWGDPSFKISDIASLQNQDEYCVLVGNCCLSSEFQQNECFAEEIVRAENKGAVAYIGASNNTYWDEDYYWSVGVGTISENPPPYEATTLGMYDRLWHTHDEPFEDWYVTTDQMVNAGNLAVTEGSPGSAEYYWEIYCVMGDPSLMVYLGVPPATAVSHLPILILNSTSFTVNTEPYAYVAISRDGVLHGAALANEYGVAELSLVPFTTPGDADLVVTRQNGEPYIGTVMVANPEGPFIMLQAHNENDLTGNQNGNIDCGEIITFDIDLRNWGNAPGEEVTATLLINNPYINVTDGYEYCGTIGAQDTSSFKNAFSFIVDPNVPDNHILDFEVIVTEAGGEEWLSELSTNAYAPVFQIEQIVVDDALSGNNNGRLDPGEEADITITCSNQGHMAAANTEMELIARTSFIEVEDPVQTIGNLGFFGNKSATFHVTVSADAPDGIVVDLVTAFHSGDIYHEIVNPIKIGMICEDFETGDFSAFNWQPGGAQPWQITNSYPFEGYYSAVSGDIDNSQTSTLSLSFEVLKPDSISFYRKVSSEAGDKLKFKINNEVVGEWSGTTGGWKRQSYPVNPGLNTFSWTFEKNGSGTAGADCGWLDYIMLPQPLSTTLYAGDDDQACASGTYQLAGQATYYSSVEWSTDGSGSFDDNTLLDPVFTPGGEPQETLTLTVFGEDGATLTDQVILTAEAAPQQPDTPEGPEYVDLQNVIISEYSIPTGEGVFEWSITPPEAGTFTGNGQHAIIIWNREFSGQAVITVAGLNSCGTGPLSEGLNVTVENTFVSIPEIPVSGIEAVAYPNPSKGNFYLYISTNGSQQLEISTMNLLGQTIDRSLIDVHDQELLHMNRSLEKGVYLIRITDGKTIITRKVIVQ